MSALAMVSVGTGILEGVASWQNAQEQYERDMMVAEYNNRLNDANYALQYTANELNAINYEVDYFENLLAIDKNELVEKGTLEINQAFNETGGNSAKLVEQSIGSAADTQEAALARSYKQQMQQIVFNRAKNELNYEAGKTWLPEEPSMLNSILTGAKGATKGYMAYQEHQANLFSAYNRRS